MSDPSYATVRHWTDLLRRVRFTHARAGVRGATIKAVALMLATYADADGSRVFPGTARISVDCEIDYRTAKRSIATLRELGLIAIVRKAARRDMADEYRLAIPTDLLEHAAVDVWSPAQHQLAVAKVKQANRGRHTPVGSQGTAGTAQAQPVVDLRDPLRTVASGPAGRGVPPDGGDAGHGVPPLRGPVCPPTIQVPGHNTHLPTGGHVPGELAVSRASRAGVDGERRVGATCPHGNSRRVRRDKTPRCRECRTQSAPASAPSRCRHGLPYRLNSHGELACPMCRRGITE